MKEWEAIADMAVQVGIHNAELSWQQCLERAAHLAEVRQQTRAEDAIGQRLIVHMLDIRYGSREWNALDALKCKTLADAARLRWEQLMELPGCGEGTALAILDKLEAIGLSFRSVPPRFR